MIFGKVAIGRKLTYMIECRRFAHDCDVAEKRRFGPELDLFNHLNGLKF